ncbi:MAG: PEFG-CTERM sorting domain-containing protein, partial [Candidatus Nitrosopumilus limneticus]|nr:PEFG-CTERM sorting domain-containing protein [Candidatus Nitrosopumilus limneticus]
MYFKIFFTLIILAIISSGVAFAQNSLISVQTDSLYYDEGDTILISGTVNTIIGNTPVTLQLFKDANLVQVAQFELSQDGNYSHTIIAEGSQWKREGEYIVKVVYGDGNIAESSFSFKPGLKTVS